MRERIIQFGEGNFLRGFVDSFVEIMNEKGLFDGKVVIVKPTPRGNLDKFNKQNCVYNLYLRGIENSKAVLRRQEIHSVSRAINPYEDYESYITLAQNPDLRFIISNTTEAGIAFDDGNAFTDRPALSFPGKLTQLLWARYKAKLSGFVILPCELIDSNAHELKKCIIKYAEKWELGEDFVEWIDKENSFCNTLVDRIVTGYPEGEAEELCREIGYEDCLLDTAEPYHIWVIEGDFENELPLSKAGINAVWTNDVKPYKKRKVRILNGAHTLMTFPALLCGLDTVGETLSDELMSKFVTQCLFNYIVPVLGSGEDFAAAVIERFKNPYIKHMLKAISLNSVSKFSVRVLSTAIEYNEKFGFYPKPFSLSLAAMLYYYKHNEVNDDKSSADFIKNSDIRAIIESDLWGADISGMYGDIKSAYSLIENAGIREAIEWSIL